MLYSNEHAHAYISRVSCGFLYGKENKITKLFFMENISSLGFPNEGCTLTCI